MMTCSAGSRGGRQGGQDACLGVSDSVRARPGARHSCPSLSAKDDFIIHGYKYIFHKVCTSISKAL